MPVDPAEIARKITRFMSQYESKQHKKGQVIIRAGDPIDSAYYLAAGQVRQYAASYRGDEVVVNTIAAPSLFPLGSTLAGLRNRFFFETSTDVRLYQAPTKDVVQFLAENPNVVFYLLHKCCVDSDSLFERLAHMMGGSARSRVSYELLVQSRLVGERRKMLVLIPLNESELAARCGLSRETVSREVHKLKNAGLLEVSRKGILLHDPDLLAEKLRVGL